MRPVPFTLEEERLLQTQLAQGDERLATKALQWLCEKLRDGAFFTDPARIRPVVKLCLYRPSPNVRRWAVNALAKLGAGGDISPVLALLPESDDDPDLLVAIVAATFSQMHEDEAATLLTQSNVQLEGISLIAASQFSLSQKRRLVETLIPLETADPGELRAAIILAGTKKAPEHLFDRRFTNAISLSQLNLHDVPSVSKYSIWALNELRLGFSSLLLGLDKLAESPPEVRKWMLRLLFSDPVWLPKHLDLLQVAQGEEAEVREEAAIELRDAFAPGMEPMITNWYFNEAHNETQSALLDHMAAQSEKTEAYEPIVTEIYKSAPPKSDKRNRIEAAAATTDLYRKLRRIEMEEESGTLFANDNDPSAGAKTVVNINQHFTNSQIGSVTATGNVSAETIQAVSQVESPEIEAVLNRIITLLMTLKSEQARKEGEQIVTEVAAKPSKSRWQRLIAFLVSVKEGVVATSGLVSGVDGLIDDVSALSNLG